MLKHVLTGDKVAQGDPPWIVEAAQDGFEAGAVEVGSLEARGVDIGKVEFAAHGIHGDALGRLEAIGSGEQGYKAASVQVRATDHVIRAAVAVFGPIDLACAGIQGDAVGDAVDDVKATSFNKSQKSKHTLVNILEMKLLYLCSIL